MNIFRDRMITLNWTVNGGLCAHTYLTEKGSKKWESYLQRHRISKGLSTPVFGPLKVRKELAAVVHRAFTNGLRPSERKLLKMTADYAWELKENGEYGRSRYYPRRGRKR